MNVSDERRETRVEKVVFEIGRGLFFGGLAATIFREEIDAAYPLAALAVGVVLLIYYIRREGKS